MRSLLVWALLSVAAFAQSSTNIGGTEGAQQVFNGTLYANAFGSWSVPQGDAGQFTWSNPNICTSLQGLTFRLFVVGLPITIVDANPALTENTTITAVHVLPSQCNIVTAPLTNSHFSFRIVSGTLGVQEAINYAQQNNLATTVHVTQAWTRLGGQTSMITGAQGNANIGILDERNTVALAFYAWNGATYNKIPIGTAAQPILCTFSTPTTNWSCAHNLGTLQVQVEYLNLTSTKIFPDSPGPCPDVNTCNATFLQPQAGYMLISFAGNVGQTQTNPNPVVVNPVSSQTITGNQPLNVTGPTTVLNNTLTVTGDNPTSLGGSLSAKRITNCRQVDSGSSFASGTDLGAKVTAAKLDGGGCMTLAQNSAYVMTTPVTTLGVNDFIDCRGSTIDISALGTVQAFQWTNASWTNVGSEFVHPLTGIQNCTFIGQNSSNTGYVGFVSRISHFYANNITIRYAGAFVIEGEAILGYYGNVKVYDPWNLTPWVTQIGSGTFGPNGTVFDHPYCEEALVSGVNCWLLQAGGVSIRSPYIEAVSTAIRLNGSGANGPSLTLDGGGSINFRKFPMVGVQIDNVQTLSHTIIRNVTFSMGDSASNAATAVSNTLANAELDFTGNTLQCFAANTASCEGIKTTAVMVMNFSGGNHVRAYTGDATFNLFDPSGGSGQFDQSLISGNEIAGDAGSTFNFTTPSAAGSFTNTKISGTFSRITNFTNLAAGVNLSSSVFIGSCPTITFTAAGLFTGNYQSTGSCSATLVGSVVRGDSGWTNTENFAATITGTNATFTGVGEFDTGLKGGASGSTIADTRELIQNAHSCGTTTTCANTANGSNRIIFGSVALSSGTPSTATITGISPAFASSASYFCSGSNATTQANPVKFANVSGSSFTITGPNTVTDVINYECVGN